jgi:hypothetical protein
MADAQNAKVVTTNQTKVNPWEKLALFCISQIGITNTYAMSKPDWVKPGQFQIFVLQKP